MVDTMTTDPLQRKLRTSRLLNLILAAALVFVTGAYAALAWGGTEQSAVGAPQEPVDGEEPRVDSSTVADDQVANEPRLETAPYMTLGDEDAPVVLYEWTDFTCPYCGLFHRDTLPTVIDEYVDTGNVRIEVHDVTFIGPQAEDAAVAARAAGLQDHYFDFLFAVYDLGRDGAKPDLSRATLFEIAESLDLDMTDFETAFDGGELRADVQRSSALARSLGITGVPAFVGTVGGSLSTAQHLQGAQPIEHVRMFLDGFLEQAGV